jgi:hypothetical protein
MLTTASHRPLRTRSVATRHDTPTTPARAFAYSTPLVVRASRLLFSLFSQISMRDAGATSYFIAGNNTLSPAQLGDPTTVLLVVAGSPFTIPATV